MKLRSALAIALLALVGPALAESPRASMDPAGALEGDTYRYGGSPAFRLALPADVRVVERTDPRAQVVRLKTPDDAVLEVSVVRVGPDFQLAAAGSFYVGALREAVGSDHRLLSSQWFELPDGTEAHDARIAWKLGDEEIQTVLVSAHVAEHWVFVAIHDDGVDLARFAHTLRFDPAAGR